MYLKVLYQDINRTTIFIFYGKDNTRELQELLVAITKDRIIVSIEREFYGDGRYSEIIGQLAKEITDKSTEHLNNLIDTYNLIYADL